MGPIASTAEDGGLFSFEDQLNAPTTRGSLSQKQTDNEKKNKKKLVWMENCLKELGGHMDLEYQHIVSRLNSCKVYVHVHGSFTGEKSGCGAILRDQQFFPLVVWSRIIPVEERISEFYSQLKAVSLGVNMALKYKKFGLEIYSSSKYVLKVIKHAWTLVMQQESRTKENGGGRGGGRGRGAAVFNYPRCGECATSVINLCKECTKNILLPDDKKDFDKVHSLLTSIMSDVLELRKQGLFGFHVLPADSISARNAAAEFLANLGEDKDMNFSEILGCEELLNILFEEAHE